MTMKLILGLVFFASLVNCFAESNFSVGKHQFIADNRFLERQNQILKLFIRFQYPSVFQEINEIGNTYKPEENLARYKNVGEVRVLAHMYNINKLVPRGKIPMLFIREQGMQAVLLFNVLYSAKDYDTFFKTACWARDRVNEVIYVYALSSAVSAREDTKYITLPPIYEVMPHLFVNEKVIQKAVDYYMTSFDIQEDNSYVIEVNRTEFMSHKYDKEQILSYFTEDIGLNAFNFFWHIQYPAWYNTTKYGLKIDRKGELFLHVQHQLLSRYSMERLSNHMEEVSYFESNKSLP